MTGFVAVFDLGKTNRKLVVFDPSGKVVAERFEPNAPLEPDAKWPYLQLDTEGAWAFLNSRVEKRRGRIPDRSDFRHHTRRVLRARD